MGPLAAIAPIIGAVASLGSGIAGAVAAHKQGKAIEGQIQKAEHTRDQLQSDISSGPHGQSGSATGLGSTGLGSTGLGSTGIGSIGAVAPSTMGSTSFLNSPAKRNSFSGSNLMGRGGS